MSRRSSKGSTREACHPEGGVAVGDRLIGFHSGRRLMRSSSSRAAYMPGTSGVRLVHTAMNARARALVVRACTRLHDLLAQRSPGERFSRNPGHWAGLGPDRGSRVNRVTQRSRGGHQSVTIGGHDPLVMKTKTLLMIGAGFVLTSVSGLAQPTIASELERGVELLEGGEDLRKAKEHLEMVIQRDKEPSSTSSAVSRASRGVPDSGPGSTGWRCVGDGSAPPARKSLANGKSGARL